MQPVAIGDEGAVLACCKMSWLPAKGAAGLEAAVGRCCLPGVMDASFDTLAMTRRLKAGGFASDQAEAVPARMTGGVATKADLAELELRLRAGTA